MDARCIYDGSKLRFLYQDEGTLLSLMTCDNCGAEYELHPDGETMREVER